MKRADDDLGNQTGTHRSSSNFSFARDKALEDFSLEKSEKEFADANVSIKVLLGAGPHSGLCNAICGAEWIINSLTDHYPLIVPLER